MDYRSISPNYISDLTDEDLHMVCDLIPLKRVRTYFKCNPQKFRKICSFSRAEKVSPELAEKRILGHRDDSFISDFVNAELSGFLDITQTRITANTESGNDIHTAFLQELPASIFCSHLDIYVKLAQKSCAEEYMVSLQNAVKEIEDVNSSPIDKISDIKEVDSEKEDFEALQAEIDALRQDLANKDLVLAEANSKHEAELPAQNPL